VVLPCLIYEDDDLLVVNKPAGLNTHAPAPYAGEGLYDWLRHREARWAKLAIIHRLDKETSGVMVFSKSSLANRSLTEQFARRFVRKRYVLLTDREIPQAPFTIRTALVRAGDKYVTGPLGAKGDLAETRFKPCVAADARRLTSTSCLLPRPSDLKHEPPRVGSYNMMDAEPLTGRTHQIRVHAATKGFPILGDILYGGAAAPRMYLHAAEITLKHPAHGREVTFSAPADFEAAARQPLRTALIEPETTDGYRMVHGASDGHPGWYVDRLGDFLLSQSERPPGARQHEELERLLKVCSARGVYHKILTRQARRVTAAQASPQHLLGEAAPEPFVIRENGLQFELSFREGDSVGLFLDQRDNRRRLLTGHVASGFPLCPSSPGTRHPVLRSASDGGGSSPTVLNCFAYTCGFSVSAAKAGALTTSLDLSKKYLERGKRNFALNQIDPAGHDFIFGDVFDWLRRLAKRGRQFDLLLLDPPTFSQSKERGIFRAEKDYAELVTSALPLVKPGGVLFASTNAADWPPKDFVACVTAAVRGAKRKILQQHYVPQPPDFPISREELSYLKTMWLRIE
jgi:23S rRNA (cytosine1962-C5)-methyltransferase